jgi:hypothetical protein
MKQPMSRVRLATRQLRFSDGRRFLGAGRNIDLARATIGGVSLLQSLSEEIDMSSRAHWFAA